jgi:hypothetical protein
MSARMAFRCVSMFDRGCHSAERRNTVFIGVIVNEQNAKDNLQLVVSKDGA